MNFIKYLKLLRNPNEKYYWYDVDKECIYIPGEDIALYLTIDEIDSIIFHRKKFKKTSKELFERIIFNEKVTFWTLNYFIKEYENNKIYQTPALCDGITVVVGELCKFLGC